MKTGINLMAIAAMLLLTLPVSGQQQKGRDNERATVDTSKRFVELPLEEALAETLNPALPVVVGDVVPDASKMKIEMPLERMLVPEPLVNSENPTVQPGMVNWHDDFESACAASGQSGTSLPSGNQHRGR